jgi:essential nuclear protein 1
MPRTTKSPSGKNRHDPLLVQLREDDIEAKYGRVSQPGRRAKRATRRDSTGAGDESGETILDPKTSRKIFELARDQQVELGVLDGDDVADEDEEDEETSAARKPRAPPVYMGDDDEEEEEIEYEEYEIDAEDEFVGRLGLLVRLACSWLWYAANRLGRYAGTRCTLAVQHE